MGWLVVPAFRTNSRSLVQDIAQRRKYPAMAAAAAGVSNGGGAYWHGCSLAVFALMDLSQKALFETFEFIQRHRAALVQSKQSLQFGDVIHGQRWWRCYVG